MADLNSSYTVLIVNDLAGPLQILTQTLKKAGCNILAASNPNAAIRLATKQNPDVIISDLSQPLTEGVDLHRRIRSTPEIAHTPILIITALHLASDTPTTADTDPGRDDFLQAPYDPTALITKIVRLIERKRTRDELKHSQARYVDLFENANDIVYTHDLEGRYTSLNKKGQEITGYTCEEAASLEFNTLASPQDVRLAKEMLRRKLAGTEPSTVYELSIRAKDGTIIPVEVNTQLIYQNGKPIGVQGIARDIRARKQAEEHLKQVTESLLQAERKAITEYKILLERIAQLAQVLSSARELNIIFKALLDFAIVSTPCSSLGIALYNHDLAQLNPHFLWIEGATIDLNTLQSIPVAANSDVHHAITSAQTIISNATTDESLTQPIFNYPSDTPKPASSILVPMTIMGRTIGTIEVQSPADNQYQAEHTTALQMAANLAANTIENVRLLNREREHENQLRQAQKMEAIGHLAGGVAHDFNNIITAIFFNCDNLTRSLTEGDLLRKLVFDIRDAATRAKLITKQLLAFSRKQVLQPVNLNLNTAIKEIERLIKSLVGDDVEISWNLDPDLPQIKADKTQLQQILMNLAVNAKDAMPNGGVITIETSLVYLDKKQQHRYTKEKSHPHIQLSFADNGVGMSAETQKQIFEPFYTTKPEGKGTGLGLSTVYGIVKQSGGYVWVSSKEGTGTKFQIDFPVAKEHLELFTETEPEQLTHHKTTQTILVAEDDHTVLDVLRDTLADAGYNVQATTNGTEAYALFQEHTDEIDLLITDVLMPQMSGHQLALLINHMKPEVKVLYISGHSTDDIINRAGINIDEVDFLQKPFNPDDVIRRVQGALAHSNTHQMVTPDLTRSNSQTKNLGGTR